MFIYTYVCAYYYSEIESLLSQFVYISISSPLMNLVFMLNVGYEMLEQHISVNSTFNYKKKKIIIIIHDYTNKTPYTSILWY